MQQPNKVIPSPEALFRVMDNEAVVLDLASASYYGLNEVGMRFWQLLEKDPSFANAHSSLLSEYDVEPERLKADLLAISEQLANSGLAKVE
jgi:Coenzyme PQQ synthesis protein D (PqqD)